MSEYAVALGHYTLPFQIKRRLKSPENGGTVCPLIYAFTQLVNVKSVSSLIAC